MAKECSPCAARAAAKAARGPAPWRTAGAVDAATSKHYEVLSAAGTPVGRQFSSLLAATEYARRIGGSTRAV